MRLEPETMWVKICGTTTHADAQLAVDAGADAVGFVFAPSKRRVNVKQVADITHSLPESLEKVGVFHQPDADEMAQIIRATGLTAAQLHFPYNPTVVASLRASGNENLKLLQVVSCSVEALDEAALRGELGRILTDPNLWGVLLDASSRGISGGTGKAFAWHRVAAILNEVWPQRLEGQGPKLILAGGLRPENIQDAIKSMRPFGVDVVSGVEASPGHKDPERVRAFVQEAKGPWHG